MIDLLADVGRFFGHWPILDIVIAIFWWWSVAAAWRGFAVSPTETDKIDERQLGATVILGQLNGVITGTSIIIAGIGAFVALASGAPASPAGRLSLLWAAVHAVLALGLALYTLGMLPTRTPKRNFVKSRAVAIRSAMALFFALAAALRFVVAVSILLFLSSTDVQKDQALQKGDASAGSALAREDSTTPSPPTSEAATATPECPAK